MVDNICVLGFGAWGAAISIHLIRERAIAGLCAWEYLDTVRKKIQLSGYHPHLGAETRVPPKIELVADMKNLRWTPKTLLIVSVAAPFVSGTLQKLKKTLEEKNWPLPYATVVLSKGIDPKTLSVPTQLIGEHLEVKDSDIFVLSGPTIAKELLQGSPTMATLAGATNGKIQKLCALFNRGRFRIRVSPHRLAAQIGGAMKNIYAIGYGILDAQGAPANARALYLVRAVEEMEVMARALGCAKGAMYEVAGLGDLLTTSLSLNSRNSRLGRLLSQGKKLEDIQKEIGMATEGVDACRSYLKLAKCHKVKLRLAQQINKILNTPTNSSKLLLNLI